MVLKKWFRVVLLRPWSPKQSAQQWKTPRFLVSTHPVPNSQPAKMRMPTPQPTHKLPHTWAALLPLPKGVLSISMASRIFEPMSGWHACAQYMCHVLCAHLFLYNDVMFYYVLLASLH